VDDDTEPRQARCQTAEQAIRHPTVNTCDEARQRHGKNHLRAYDIPVEQEPSRTRPALVDHRSNPNCGSITTLGRDDAQGDDFKGSQVEVDRQAVIGQDRGGSTVRLLKEIDPLNSLQT
jgi:hypothetical protein